MALRLSGLAASDGLFAGPVHHLTGQELTRESSGDPAHETEALRSAIADAQADLAQLASQLEDEEAAAIIGFQIALSEDDALTEPCWAKIDAGAPADAAWTTALNAQIDDYSASEDEYFRARTADLADLRDRVLQHLSGTMADMAPGGSVLVGEDLSPSQFLSHDWGLGGAIVLSEGSSTSHVAMLARARGIPMLVQVKDLPREGTQALVNAADGTVLIDPTAEDRTGFLAASRSAAQRQSLDESFLLRPARRKDGSPVKLFVNIAGPDDVARINVDACDGVGLMRSEFLFRDGAPLPSEDVQYDAYRRVLEWAGTRPVTIRTLDIGGDKPIRGLTPEDEDNPFLGLRGVRLTLARPDVFRVQLRALARAAVYGNLLVMLPMVTVPSELEESAALLDDVVETLQQEGVACKRPPLGIMVEVPAVAVAPELFQQAAFFSIGSNDLTQYVTAASREGGDVAALNDPSHPAVLKLIASVAAYGKAAKIPVSICGDMASDDGFTATLMQCGLTSLSVAPARVGRIKRALAES